ncbi:hypothetical protein JXA85_05115 [Candidatus Woesearchaeota archaeon]|nr:hypothetical protein [Candidatus Woesearchaeota archaeon]
MAETSIDSGIENIVSEILVRAGRLKQGEKVNLAELDASLFPERFTLASSFRRYEVSINGNTFYVLPLTKAEKPLVCLFPEISAVPFVEANIINSLFIIEKIKPSYVPIRQLTDPNPESLGKALGELLYELHYRNIPYKDDLVSNAGNCRLFVNPETYELRLYPFFKEQQRNHINYPDFFSEDLWSAIKAMLYFYVNDEEKHSLAKKSFIESYKIPEIIESHNRIMKNIYVRKAHLLKAYSLPSSQP